jgi:hypothetical protein
MAKKKIASPAPSTPKSTLLAFGFTSAKKVKKTTTKDDPSSPASVIVKKIDEQEVSIIKRAKTTILATTTKNNKKVEVPTTNKGPVSKQPSLRKPPPPQVPKKAAPVTADKEQETKGGRPKRTRTTVSSYKDTTIDDDDDDEHMLEDSSDDKEEDDEPPPTKRRLAKKPTAPAKATKKISTKPSKQRKATVEDDEDDFVLNDHSSEEEDEDDNMSLDDEEETKVKTSRAKSNKKTASSRKSASSSKTAALTKGDSSIINNKKLRAEFDAKMAKDRNAYKPVNNPQKWPKDGSYVDPVGVDPTHGIVEGIVSAQVRKVGRLLQLVSARQEDGRTTTTNKKNSQKSVTVDNDSLAELSYPIRLQTACSGTDAPSIALGLIKESLDKLCAAGEGNRDSTKGGGAGHLFDYTHEMSCEIEPFKQAYIGRNFPGVPLFPDITKLTASEQVLDVYGRPQRIPKGNLFVAGTSCKDFSMLKTSYRLDIEDKGTSGETFLSAVEFLDQEQPPMAIFENVDGAPWGKMQEYIRGRIHLADRNDTKAIKDANKKAGECFVWKMEWNE